MAGKVKLTHKTVADATCRPGAKDVLITDLEIPGFALRVGSNGSKTFLVQVTTAAGERRRVRIGAFGVLTAEEARQRARVIVGDAARGVDPVAEKRAAVAARRAAEAAAKARAAEDAFTFGRLIDAWLAAREGDRRPGYLRPAHGTMRLHLADWLARPAGGITTAEAVRMLDTIKAAGSPIVANRALSYARAAYGWALRRQMVDRNPLAGIERPAAERSRDRVLTAEELADVWRAAGILSAPYDAFVRVLMLTLARRDEVARMSWAELAPDLSIWTLPRERAKNDKGHVVHLAEPVRAILSALPRLKDSPFVFPAASGKPISAYSAAKRQIDAAVAKARAGSATGPAGLPDWRLHDFRRSGVTALADMGFPPHVCDRLLNHVGGAISGVAAVYQRAEFMAERRAALDAWAAHVVSAAEGKPTAQNVTILRRAV